MSSRSIAALAPKRCYSRFISRTSFVKPDSLHKPKCLSASSFEQSPPEILS
jgi:hypothetical protein